MCYPKSYTDVALETPVHTETYENEVINVFKSPKVLKKNNFKIMSLQHGMLLIFCQWFFSWQVTEYVQDYFNCSSETIDYAPLENNGGAGSAS